MDQDLLISLEHAGKKYRMYDNPKDRLKQALWGRKKVYYREFWALSDVSLELRKGETLGIIGVNGAGKSTLLQILAGTLQPTTGVAQVRGRVAALLELGSGFNPDYTGRENVYLNGSILGMSHEEIDHRFEEIASFAGIGTFMEQPVSTYSTGMVVRLAFSVQALLEPDILIVDEALAVGDAAFQFKCLSRMKRLIQQGVAVILVTHDVNTVRSFCNRVIWLHQGEIKDQGEPKEITSRYIQFIFGTTGQQGIQLPENSLPPEPPQESAPFTGGLTAKLEGQNDFIRWGSGEVRLLEAGIQGRGVDGASEIAHGTPLAVHMVVEAGNGYDGSEFGVGFSFRNNNGLDIITYTTLEQGLRLPSLRFGQALRLTFTLENILSPGNYALVAAIERITDSHERSYLDFVENALIFQVLSNTPIFSVVLPQVTVEIQETSSPMDHPQGD